LFVAALVLVDGAYVVIHDRLALGAAYLAENNQSILEAFQRVPVVAGMQLHFPEVIKSLSLAALVAHVPVQRERFLQVVERVRITTEVPAGERRMAQCIGHSVRVINASVKSSGLVKIGQCLAGPARALMGLSHMIERLG